MLQLLARGESAHRIRVLDINLPLRDDLQTGAALAVDFRQVDVTDRLALLAAFTAVWPDDVDLATPTTVFHTASTIRFYERHPALLSRSERVNVGGTQNVLDAARAVGADVLLYTSSGSITVRRTRFLLWPWEKRPAHFVQALDDNDALLSEDPGLLWSNYAVSKQKAEQLVRRADETRSGESILRTGCIRPSNGTHILCPACFDRFVYIGFQVSMGSVEILSPAHSSFANLTQLGFRTLFTTLLLCVWIYTFLQFILMQLR